jgi:hypothetical protein
MTKNSPSLAMDDVARCRPFATKPPPTPQCAFLPLSGCSWPPGTRTGALVVMLFGLVHCLDGTTATEAADSGQVPLSSSPSRMKPPAVRRVALEDLPIPVQEMRDAILIAVASGDIEELRTAIEWNELPPELGMPKGTDPIEQFRKISTDGEGREILAILGDLLAEAPAQLPIGPDPENSSVFVWPYLSELPPKLLTPSQLVDLYRLMPVPEAAKLIKRDKWTWYRLAIAADGTWHIFSKSEN